MSELLNDFIFILDFVKGAQEKRNIWNGMTFLSDFFTNVTLTVLKNPQVQDLIKTATFDLIILEAVNTDAWYGFGAHFKAPIIAVSSYGTDPIIDDIMGNISPFSYVPLMSTGFTEEMSFPQRLWNLVMKLLELVHNRWVHLPRHEAIKASYMPDVREDICDLRKNISLFLLNQHFSLSSPRPYVTNMIEVGGFQIQPHAEQTLPQTVAEFLNSTQQDVIYFSMGSNIKSKDFPLHIQQLFNEVFAALPCKVLWKFENPELEGKPANVLISSWFPQADILAHPKVKLFISHGGLLSTFEAIYHGKPVLGLPVFFDQQLNVNKAKRQGFALALDFANLKREDLETAILEMLKNPAYGQKAKEISNKYHDQPIKPLDLAIFWTEYVLRHKGAYHLQSPAQKMDYFKKHGIDCVASLIFGLVGVSLLIVWSLKKICKICFAKKPGKVKEN